MYALNAETAKAAKGADQTSNRIDETGKYKGKFIRAEAVTAASGTKGIDFDFVSEDGRKARFSIYTLKSDGSQTFGFKQVMAIMACLGLRNLAEPTMVQARVWQNDQETDMEVPQFPELLNKPIGVLFAMEEYEKSDKSGTRWRPALKGVFQAATELVATELLDRKTQPLQLPKMVQALRDIPLRSKGAGTRATSSASNNSENPAAGTDDDPFAGI